LIKLRHMIFVVYLARQLSNLQSQNEELKRKERLLQFSVRTTDDALNTLTNPSLCKNLAELIKARD
jgi:hypothetical protein